MAFSQGAQKTDILNEVSFWVISSKVPCIIFSIQVSKLIGLDRNKCLWTKCANDLTWFGAFETRKSIWTDRSEDLQNINHFVFAQQFLLIQAFRQSSVLCAKQLYMGADILDRFANVSRGESHETSYEENYVIDILRFYMQTYLGIFCLNWKYILYRIFIFFFFNLNIISWYVKPYRPFKIRVE
jgi:hypothetical protein